jgi:hypothetical protein
MKIASRYSALLAGLVLSASSQALIITSENNGATIASTIAGSGISVSNVNYAGAAGASGTFIGGNSSGLSIEKGVVLSSGQALLAQGPNDSTNATADNSRLGYAPLDTLAAAPTYDATVLGFDFEFDGGLGGDLFFNFVFGSEEYLEFVDSGYNDVFGFFVDGINVALVPGTSDPVSIDNINTTKNPSLFVDNTSGTYNTQIDGFTKVLQININDLSAGTHRMEFAIADVGDHVLDSWIFIQADSFSNEPVGVPEPGALLLLGLGLLSLVVARKRA